MRNDVQMTPSAAVVFVVDDDASVRKSLSRLISEAGYRVQAFASPREFLAREPTAGPSCLVLDVRMPGVTGLELQQTLARAVHEIPIIFITGHGDIPMSVKAMKAGAVDFLAKPFAAKELLDAIRRAVAKDTRDLGTEARDDEIQARVRLLTPRESQVFALVVTGMLNKQIAAQLGVGEKTVKVHRARVMEKMQAGSVAALVRLADAAGITAVKETDGSDRPAEKTGGQGRD
jgi:FixJ family two-component response regulator